MMAQPSSPSLIAAAAVCCLLAAPAAGGSPDTAAISALIEQLDSDRFDTREDAARQLRTLSDDPSATVQIAEVAQRRLLSAPVSFELQTRLRWLLAELQAAGPPPPAEGADQLDALVAALDADSFAARRAAAEQLTWLLDRPDLVTPILLRLKERRIESEIGDRPLLDRVWRQARGAWLAADPRQWRLPAVADEQIADWIEQLSHDNADNDGLDSQARAAANEVAAPPEEIDDALSPVQQELVDLLARDDHRERVVAAVERRLADSHLSDDARRRLTAVLDWTRPALVAEFWNGGRNLGVQYLYVDVPTTPEQGLRPSHFDRIDDHTAHCVSGNSLSAGDYPVGVLFPHPRNNDSQFCIVNLPTPLRRLQFEHVTNVDDRRRWPILCQRTLDRLLAERRPLVEAELQMLYFLDAKAVSRFAGPYLGAVDDGPYGPEGRYYGDVGNISRHGVLMLVLAHQGTREAIEGLTSAIANERVRRASADAPYNLPWFAALAIAARDPWREVDSWLAERVMVDETLVIDRQDGPRVGATAAGILLLRHGIEPGRLGLMEADDDVLEEAGLIGYRYTASDQSQAVQDAWRRKSVAEGRTP